MNNILVDSAGNYWSISITPNGELQATELNTQPSSSSGLCVQDILDRVVQDSDNTIGSSHAALIGYINRVHEQLLRASQWNFLRAPVQTFNTVEGSTNYYFGTGTAPNSAVQTNLSLSNFHRIDPKSVLDRTNNRQLSPVQVVPLGSVFTQSAYPRVYVTDALNQPGVLSLYPPPNGVFEIQFRYFIPRAVLTLPTDFLQIPDEYADVLIAGVNVLVAKLQNRDNDVVYWNQLYNEGKRDMIRDTHPYSIDMIRPDPASGSGNYINSVDPPFFAQF